MQAWAFVLVGIFCLARAVFDAREKRYAWAAFGFVAGLGVLLMPMPTPLPMEAVKIDMPVAAGH